jgi:hypothetical protein
MNADFNIKVCLTPPRRILAPPISRHHETGSACGSVAARCARKRCQAEPQLVLNIGVARPELQHTSLASQAPTLSDHLLANRSQLPVQHDHDLHFGWPLRHRNIRHDIRTIQPPLRSAKKSLLILII